MTPKRSSSNTSATRSAPPSQAAEVELREGADGVWEPAKVVPTAPTVAAPGRRVRASAMVKGGQGEKRSCVLCGKPVNTRAVRATFGVLAIDVPVCRKCGEMGLYLYGILRR